MLGAMNSTRRKLAIATWTAPSEGNIYGKLTLDATRALAWIAQVREASGEKVTITHLIGKAIAEALHEAPGLNGYLRLGTYIPHDTVDISFLVALDDGADLAKVKITDAHLKSPVDIAKELRARAEKVRAGKDDDFERTKGLLRVLPSFIIRPIVWLTGWLSSSLGLNLPALGVEAFPFGSCIITNVGMFGIDEAFAPHTPFARVPVLVLVGAVKDAPAVVDGQLVVRPQITITATIDHRFVDGTQLGVLAGTLRDLIEDPFQLDEGTATVQVVTDSAGG